MTQEETEPAPAPDPGNAPPEEWTGEPVGLEEEQAMIDAALAEDVAEAAYPPGVPGGL